MKHLILVRHAKSSWKKDGVSDHDRPLNERGKADAPKMAERLASRPIPVDFLISSTAKRAARTAGVFAEALGLDEDQQEYSRELYLAELEDLFDYIRNTDDRIDALAYFGHNPGITEFANQLSSASIDDMPTCGMASFRLNIERWSELSAGCGSLMHFDYPKAL